MKKLLPILALLILFSCEKDFHDCDFLQPDQSFVQSYNYPCTDCYYFSDKVPCTDCYFSFQFLDQTYRYDWEDLREGLIFKTTRIENDTNIEMSYMLEFLRIDDIFEFRIQKAVDTITLNNIINTNQVMVHHDSLLIIDAPLITSFKLKDLCGNSFYTNSHDSNNTSYNKITEIEIMEVGTHWTDNFMVRYMITGNFKTTINISGSSKNIMGDYKIINTIIMYD